MIKSVTYAAADVSKRSWLQTPINRSDKSKRTTGKVLTIVNPIFDDYASLTDDPYWKDVFVSAARGVFPKKFGYKDGLLVYRKGTKDITMVVTQHTTLDQIQKFFRHNGGMISDRDIEMDITREETESYDSPQVISFDELSRKKQKKIFIINYLYDLSSSLKLNKQERDNLIKTISLALTLDQLDDENVIMRDGAICDISGLRVIGTAPNRTFRIKCVESLCRDKLRQCSRTSRSTKLTPDMFMKSWEKYISSYMKMPTKSRSAGDNTTVSLNLPTID
jgi:hypothetical protein